MPKLGLTQKYELETRNKFTKVDAELNFIVDGRELPTMAVLGEALEKAQQLIQEMITESYQEVPARTDTAMAEPYKP